MEVFFSPLCPFPRDYVPHLLSLCCYLTSSMLSKHCLSWHFFSWKVMVNSEPTLSLMKRGQSFQCVQLSLTFNGLSLICTLLMHIALLVQTSISTTFTAQIWAVRTKTEQRNDREKLWLSELLFFQVHRDKSSTQRILYSSMRQESIGQVKAYKWDNLVTISSFYLGHSYQIQRQYNHTMDDLKCPSTSYKRHQTRSKQQGGWKGDSISYFTNEPSPVSHITVLYQFYLHLDFIISINYRQ